jgi:FtsP/CotA-like multicopper oxidase with cupredoxin domain
VPYRLRFWNGANSRIFKLAWADATPLKVVATDGGLLATPVQREYVTLAPGERVELLVNFGLWPDGTDLVLKSLEFSGASPFDGQPLPNGADFAVMRFQVNHDEHTTLLPLISNGSAPKYGTGAVKVERPLSAFERYQPEDAVNVDSPRRFELFMQHMNWTINGRAFEMDAVAPNEIVQLGTQEIWEFGNSAFGGMGMMQMAHPMHVHGLQFQVLSRQPPSDATQRTHWETVKDGYVDDGWKDTVLLMPGERVQIQLAFKDHAGLFLYHCHNLEHEDMGMMRNYQVQDASVTYVT